MPEARFITGVAHLGLRVRDLAVARDFYEKLGFVFVIGPIGPEPVAILEHPSGIELNLVINAAPGSDTNVLMDVETKHPGWTHVALGVADLDETMKALQAAGIALSGGPMTFPHGARAVFVRDPDRNVIELHEPVRGHGHTPA